jgi:hypothetical protein
MPASLLRTPAPKCAPLPFLADDDQSTTILLFVRALAIRQARVDACQALEPTNDNERRTVH